MPSTMFKGKSEMGYRGDAILQLDWTVGEIMKHLEYLGIAKNTIIIFSSDNGPVLDDGYQDEAVAKLNGHTPAGVLRGEKCSVFEGGTRIPMIVSWPMKIKQGVSDALLCQIDLLCSFSKILNIKLPESVTIDSEDMSDVMLGKSVKGRDVLVEQGMESLAIVQGNWKYIEPNRKPAMNMSVNMLNEQPQLYNLNTDIGEKTNLADKYPEELNKLFDLLQKIKAGKNNK